MVAELWSGFIGPFFGLPARMFQHKKDATTDNTAMDVEEDPAVRNLPLCVLPSQLVWHFSTRIFV